MTPNQVFICCVFLNVIECSFFYTKSLSQLLGLTSQETKGYNTDVSQHTRRHSVKQIAQMKWSVCKFQAFDTTVSRWWFNTVHHWLPCIQTTCSSAFPYAGVYSFIVSWQRYVWSYAIYSFSSQSPSADRCP